MMQLWEQWDQLDDRARAPYEARAANHAQARVANRYRREVLFTILPISRRQRLHINQQEHAESTNSAKSVALSPSGD